MIDIERINKFHEGFSEFIGKPRNDKMADGNRIAELEAELTEAKAVIAELNRVFERDCDKEERLETELESVKTALFALYKWVIAEVDHFEANMPDDDLIELVEKYLEVEENNARE